MGFFPRTHAVLGVMRDKDIAAMLERYGYRAGPRPYHLNCSTTSHLRMLALLPALQRAPQGPMSVQDRQDEHTLRLDEVDQPIGPNDEFAKAR